MLVPLSWLKQFVDINVPVEVLAERLTAAGLEVGHLHYLGLPQTDWSQIESRVEQSWDHAATPRLRERFGR